MNDILNCYQVINRHIQSVYNVSSNKVENIIDPFHLYLYKLNESISIGTIKINQHFSEFVNPLENEIRNKYLDNENAIMVLLECEKMERFKQEFINRRDFSLTMYQDILTEIRSINMCTDVYINLGFKDLKEIKSI